MIAKRLGLPYLPGSREGVVKVKAHKTADCVVVGVRWKEEPTRLATLLLGLYREDGELDYVGSAAVAASRHDEILKRVKPLLKGAPDRGFSEPNRWGGGELAQSAIKPKLVVEVRYDKVQGNRFRHGTKLIRFRDDKDPEQCTWREVRKPPGPDDLTVGSLLRPVTGSSLSPPYVGSSRPSFSNFDRSETFRRHMPAVRSPTASIRSRIVVRVNAAGSQSGTSSHVIGADARASGIGRIEYADAIVRSRAFWP